MSLTGFVGVPTERPRRCNFQAAHQEMPPGASHEACVVECMASLEDWEVVCLAEWAVVSLELEL